MSVLSEKQESLLTSLLVRDKNLCKLIAKGYPMLPEAQAAVTQIAHALLGICPGIPGIVPGIVPWRSL